MSSFIVGIAKERKLDDGSKGIEDFLDGLVVAFSYYGERENFLTCFSDVNNPGDVMMSMGHQNRMGFQKGVVIPLTNLESERDVFVFVGVGDCSRLLKFLKFG